jgi:hypothetical protein
VAVDPPAIQPGVPAEVQVSSLYAAVIAGEPGSVETARRFVGATDDKTVESLSLFWVLSAAVAEAEGPGGARRLAPAVKAVKTGLQHGAEPRSVLVERAEMLLQDLAELTDDPLSELLAASLRSVLQPPPPEARMKLSPPQSLVKTARLHAKVCGPVRKLELSKSESPLSCEEVRTPTWHGSAALRASPVLASPARPDPRTAGFSPDFGVLTDHGARAPPPSPATPFERKLRLRGAALVEEALKELSSQRTAESPGVTAPRARSGSLSPPYGGVRAVGSVVSLEGSSILSPALKPALLQPAAQPVVSLAVKPAPR